MLFVNIAGIAVSGFFIVFILSKKNRKASDYLLVLINLLMISLLVIGLLVEEKLTIIRFFIQALLPYFLFPVFFIFALEALQEKIHHGSRWMVAFIPALITTAYLTWDLFIHNSYTEETIEELFNLPPLTYHIIYKGNQIYFIVSLVWLIKKLRGHTQKIKERFSFIDPIQLNWLTRFSWIYLAITIISLTSFLLVNFGFVPFDIQFVYSILGASLVLSIFYISYHGIKQYSVAEYYGSQPSGPATKLEEPDPKEKYKTSSLTPDQQSIIYKNLLQLFEEKKIYAQPQLQLNEAAQTLDVTPHNLSQTINSITHKPFYDLVNTYRVRHLQQLLEDPDNKKFTILALGLESGFNSKATLNRVFREETGLSPSEYQKRYTKK